MDDLMNKVGALIEAHVKSEVEARAASDWPSVARSLGFWEKLVETLCLGPAKEATFDDVMAKIQTLREERDSIARIADIRFKVIEAERSVANDALARRDKAVADAEEKADALDTMRNDRNKYRAMWEQLHRAQGKDLEAKELSQERDLRLCSERDEAKAQLEVACAKVRELDAKLLEVRKAVGEKARPKVDDKVRCGHWHGAVIGFRVEDGAVMVRRTYNGGSELRYLKADELEIIAP